MIVATQNLIRWMIARDLPEVLEIERHDNPIPWDETMLKTILSQRNCIGMVAESGEKVVGFIVYELRSKRIDLLNIAVHKDWRRMGVGTELIQKIAKKLDRGHRETCWADVPESNLPALHFLRAQRFLATKLMRAKDDGEDWIVMEYSL